jgi:hypothetical protein
VSPLIPGNRERLCLYRMLNVLPVSVGDGGGLLLRLDRAQRPLDDLGTNCISNISLSSAAMVVTDHLEQISISENSHAVSDKGVGPKREAQDLCIRCRRRRRGSDSLLSQLNLRWAGDDPLTKIVPMP